MTEFKPRDVCLSEIEKKVTSDQVLHICNTLLERQIINGEEAGVMLRLKPMGIALELLYLTKDQVRPAQYKEVAIEFGRQLNPAVEKDVIENETINATQVIELCLTAHKMEIQPWNEGILLLTHCRSQNWQKIFNSMDALQIARNKAIEWIADPSFLKICVFVDKAVRKNFIMENEKTSNPSDDKVSDNLDENLETLENLTKEIHAFSAKFRYQSPEVLLQHAMEIHEKADVLLRLVEKIKTMVDDLEHATTSNIRDLQKKLETSRKLRDDLALELESQMKDMETKAKNYEGRIEDLFNQLKLSDRTPERDEKIQELKEVISQMETQQITENMRVKRIVTGLEIELTKTTSQNTIYRDKLLDAENDLKRLQRKREEIAKTDALCETAKELPSISSIKKKLKELKAEEQEEKYKPKEESSSSSDTEDDEMTGIPPKVAKRTISSLDETTSKESVKVSTPAKYGMKTWNPVTTTIFQHLSSLKIGLSQAERQKIPMNSRQNLILLTLPGEYHFVNDFISEEDRVSMEKFTTKIVEIIAGSTQEQLSNFLREQRKPNEPILAYFSRIKNLYTHSTGNSTNLDKDQFGVRLIYQKMYEGMDRVQASDLQRLCEKAIGDGTLSLAELMGNVARAARKTPIPSTSLNAFRTPATPPNSPRESTAATYVHPDECTYCKKIGHRAEYCFRKRADIIKTEKRQRQGLSRRLFAESKEKNDESGRRDKADK